MFACVIFVLYLNLFDDLKHLSVTNMQKKEKKSGTLFHTTVDVCTICLCVHVSVSLKGSDVTPLAQTASAFGVSSNRAGFRQNVGVTLRIRQTGSQPRIQSGLKEWCSVQALTWWRDVHFPQPVIKLKLYGAAAAIGPANLSASRPGCDASVRHVLCTLQTIIWPDESSGWESSSSFLECLDFIWNALNGQTWECQGEQVLYGSLRSVRAFHCSSSPMIRFFTRRNRRTY